MFAALKETYEGSPSTLDDAMIMVLQDLRSFFENGVKVQVGGRSVCLRGAVTGIKGDMPWLIASGHLERHFRRQPKRGSSGMSCPGICWLCLAGTENLPFTDLSKQPGWEATMASAASLTPWETLPPWLELPHQLSWPGWLWRPDIFHNWHLGTGKCFLASALVVLQGFEPAASVENRFNLLTAKWLAYCRSRKVSWPCITVL